MLNRAKEGKATAQQLFDYYLGGSPTRASRTTSSRSGRRRRVRAPVGDAGRGRRPAAGRQAAKEKGRHVVVGGHSLGGSITTAYATWDFNGKPGVKGLAGLVFIDGG